MSQITELIKAAEQLENAPQENRRFKWFSRGTSRQDEIYKSLGEELVKSLSHQVKAAEQGTVVNATMDTFGVYDSPNGIRDKTDASFHALRNIANNCEIISAIIEKRITQVAAFCQLPDVRYGYVRRPGFKIRMRKPESPATEEDRQRMTELERFFMKTGFTAPPKNEQPVGWKPGFEYFTRQVIRDALTLDWVAVRRWKSEDDPEKFPIVAFAALDAGKVRRVRPEMKKIKDGVISYGPWKGQRTTNDKEISFIKLSSTLMGVITDEFTDEEVAVGVRNPRSDETSNGYGYCELERAMNAALIWINSREYNSSRFQKDHLPRGVMVLFGQVDQKQLDMFRLSWRQMTEGKRWGIPMLSGPAQPGGMLNFVPFDLSSREMEYHQFMFSVCLWMHSLYGIHPEETGLEALSPNRPPLSQSSPQTKLEYSQDSGLTPLLRWYQNFINEEILWKVVPDERYVFEFVGTGQYDEVQDIQMNLMLLQAGLATPRMIWNQLDQPIPDAIADHPAWDLPMPIAEGFQYVDQLRTASMQEQQNQQAQQMEAMQSQQKDKLDRMRMMQGMGMPPNGMNSNVPDLTQMNPSPPQGAIPPPPENLQKAFNRYSAFPERLWTAFDKPKNRPVIVNVKEEKKDG